MTWRVDTPVEPFFVINNYNYKLLHVRHKDGRRVEYVQIVETKPAFFRASTHSEDNYMVTRKFTISLLSSSAPCNDFYALHTGLICEHYKSLLLLNKTSNITYLVVNNIVVVSSKLYDIVFW